MYLGIIFFVWYLLFIVSIKLFDIREIKYFVEYSLVRFSSVTVLNRNIVSNALLCRYKRNCACIIGKFYQEHKSL